MKKSLRKFLALAACLMLVFALAIPASAVTIGWVDGDNTYTAVVTATSTSDVKKVKYSSATTVEHTKGNTDKVQYGYGDTVSFSWYLSANGRPYSTYLYAAMEELGLTSQKTDKSDKTASVNYAIVLATMPSGKYTVGSQFTQITGTWSVTNSFASVTPSATYATTNGTTVTGTFYGPSESAAPVSDVLYAIS